MDQPQKAKLPGVGALFTETWNLYRSRAITLITIGVLSTIALFITSFLFGLIGGFASPEAQQANAHPLLAFLSALTNLVLVVIISVWQSAALVIAILRFDQNLSPVECYKQAWKYVLKYFLVMLIFMIFMFGGMVLLVIPAVYLGVILGFAPVIIIAEEGQAKVWSSFKRSRFYAKGYWWAIFGRYLFLLLVLLCFTLLMGLVVFFPLSLIAMAVKPVGNQFQQIGSAIVDIFLTPFSFAYWILLYTHLKKIKYAAE